MGATNSKAEKNEALSLCRERKRFIKVAIDSRYALAAAHVSYIQSLRNVGISLRRYAEAEVVAESSLSVSDKTPSQTSYPSPSPSHVAEVEVSESPLHNESPLSPPVATTLSYMRSGGSAAVTVTVNACGNINYLDDESTVVPMPPPPPPPPESGASWDFFDPGEDSESFRFAVHCSDSRECRDEENRDQWLHIGSDGHCMMQPNLDEKFGKFSSDAMGNEGGNSYAPYLDHSIVSRGVEGGKQKVHGEVREIELPSDAGEVSRAVADKGAGGRSSSKKEKNMAGKNVSAEREDPSEFITHRAKDFLSSIKDIEHRFIRASESGREVLRLLEANKIKVGYSEAKVKSSTMDMLSAFQPVCCGGKASPVFQEPAQKIISWKRTASSRSSSSKNALAAKTKEDVDDSGSDFVEEVCMIAGSHSSTLDRLYAWERKLYDEVKASESIMKEYDRKCHQLRHQFAKDQGSHVIDKTRSVVKDLHSRLRVAIYSVDSISKRIERMRDEELLPQLLEFTEGLIRMWKAMLECHHAQYITISLAYHSRNSTETLLRGEVRREIMTRLLEEVEFFGLSFANWINSLTSYVEALNAWLQNCILLPRERSKSRRPFSPRRLLAPPIFVLCRDWSAGIKALPSEELSQAIIDFLSDLHLRTEQQNDQLFRKQNSVNARTAETEESKTNEDNEDESANLSCIHARLTKVLDRLTKFSEASLKMYEDIRQKSEAARNAYHNCRTLRAEKA
ncbi:nitrate regulatory gene2 protein [Vigna radiata var. radiata]|uniref:Nitrate regulatory gene2 protein n=1 Tax=Vigna radiata var. radiata TaxID=3916 RepID=A0A1S3UST0_VIGRR|nr:nitrate regulatory gene2 protein [Vigna radiata var. radiata]